MIRSFDYTDIKEKKMFLDILNDRNRRMNDDIAEKVSVIIKDIRDCGDRKLFEYTERFDGVKLDCGSIKVTDAEIGEAYGKIGAPLIGTIRKAAANIREYHKKQMQESFCFSKGKSSRLGQMVRPLETVGIYVPGGTAPLPSSVLMNAVPAKIAGVKKIIMATPPKINGIDPSILVAAREAGVDAIYKMGGAQAIAAMAYGTESVPKADKITGPGNEYVAAAKKAVFGVCGIDMIAGPSEICIIADSSADPEYIAADMLSQAEHGNGASSVLITTDRTLIVTVAKAIETQLGSLERKEMAGKSLEDNGALVYAGSIDQAVGIADMIAPEHLEMMFEDADIYAGKIKNAGAVFVGKYSPEPLGDYFAGANHILPTSGTARFFSPLGVYDFLKRISYINYSREDLLEVKDDIIRFAECEGLLAHADSIKIRFGG
jgi:histidinol dehydrogenase